MSFHRVWQENEFESDDVFESISAFKKNGFVASRFLLGPFCYGDLRNSAIINYNGDVYKCTAVNFIDTPRDGYLNSEGDIIWEMIVWRKEWRQSSQISLVLSVKSCRFVMEDARLNL